MTKLRRVTLIPLIGRNKKALFHEWVTVDNFVKAIVEMNNGTIELWGHKLIKFDPLWLHNTKTKQ